MSAMTRRMVSGFLFSLVAICCASAVIADGPKASAASKTPSSKIVRNFGNLPLSFEPNQGQANPAARYIAHGRSSTVYLTPTAATIVVTHVPGASRRDLATVSTRAGGKLDSDILKQVRSSALTIIIKVSVTIFIRDGPGVTV